ncbi:carboxylesterase/lipase family protein [Streptomyces fractus]|uniref:carboxylesterase/lipase family protein n=1 Tax=Streptomyces fractus TaxID=641806 RepID=UPI003CF51052
MEAAALVIAVLAALLTASPAGAQTAADPSVVSTDKGAVRGNVTDGYRTFKGIPFAAPPTGDLRWKPPRPATAWSGIRDATQKGSSCVQGSAEASTGSEDCLFLNVTTPLSAESSPTGRPVMVYIHGGSFTGGSGDIDASRLSTDGNVIVVSLNYRLGVFGFLGHPGLDTSESSSGNFGLQDQQAGLRWVQHNIAAFGGDPDNVTLFGGSAGAMSVCYQLASPDTVGLFDKAIMESGSCTAKIGTLPEAEKSHARFTEQAGCTGSGAETAACLRGKSSAEILKASVTGDNFNWSPLAGTSTLPQQPAEGIADRPGPPIPTIYGGNTDEASVFMALQFDLAGNPVTADSYKSQIRAGYGDDADAVLAKYPVSDYSSPLTALSTVMSDCGIPSLLSWCSYLRSAKVLSQKAPVYVYEFADTTVRQLFPGLNLGVYHGAEASYVFPGLLGEMTPEQQALSDQMVDYWTRFAATGDPNGHGSPAWPAYRESNDALHLATGSNGIRTFDVAERHKIGFWNKHPVPGI